MVTTAAIAGAGIAGLAAALALARRGIEVRVLEQAPALGEVGAGLQLSPNAMKVMGALGLEAAVIAAGFEPEAALLRDWRSGHTWLEAPLKSACRRRYGAPYVHIHRADLHALLAEAACGAGVAIETGRQVSGYAPDGSGARLVLDDGGTVPGDLVIGADGVRSVIRNAMLGPEKPGFTGQVAWRGVVPADRVPAGLVAPSATVWAGPGRHFVTYWLRGGQLVNFVAVEERRDWREEGWNIPGDPAELRAAFGDWHPSVARLVAEVDETFLWALFGRPELPRWQDGRAVLIGDACHPTLPFMAQGAAMAIEDAWVLAGLVAGTGDIVAALARFEALRKPRATWLQAKARRNAALFHLSEGPGGLVSKAKLRAASLLRGEAALAPLDRVYGYDATGIVTTP